MQERFEVKQDSMGVNRAQAIKVYTSFIFSFLPPWDVLTFFLIFTGPHFSEFLSLHVGDDCSVTVVCKVKPRPNGLVTPQWMSLGGSSGREGGGGRGGGGVIKTPQQSKVDICSFRTGHFVELCRIQPMTTHLKGSKLTPRQSDYTKGR